MSRDETDCGLHEIRLEYCNLEMRTEHSHNWHNRQVLPGPCVDGFIRIVHGLGLHSRGLTLHTSRTNFGLMGLFHAGLFRDKFISFS